MLVMTGTFLTSLCQERGKCGKQQKMWKKKKASFSFVFAMSRGERCENRKKNYIVRGVMGCQTVRRWEGKMKSRGEGRGEDTKMLSP